MLRLLVLAASLALAGPALAFDVKTSTTPGNVPTLVTPGEIAINRADKTLFFKKSDNTVGTATLLNALAAGKKAVEQGDASDLIAKAPGLPAGASLATWLATPYFLAASTPYVANAYASAPGAESGKAAFAFVANDTSAGLPNKERYAGWFANIGPGTGRPEVLASSFGLGVSSLKDSWYNTGVPGQQIGLQIIARGGYHRTTTDECADGIMADGTTPCPGGANNLFAANDPVPSHPEFGGYNPSGDLAGIIYNGVQSSPYAYHAAAELAVHYMLNGIANTSGDVHSMNIQLGTMKQKSPDGSPYNPGIGLHMTAQYGNLDYAISAVNSARPAPLDPIQIPGHWKGFARYNRDDGTNPPYDAFRVDQDGTTCWRHATGSTPSKCIRAGSDGTLQVLNNAGDVVARIGDNGSLYIDQAGALVIMGSQVVGPQQAAISDALTDSQKITAILARLRSHGLIAP
jgi:hypothetical protein